MAIGYKSVALTAAVIGNNRILFIHSSYYIRNLSMGMANGN